MSTIFILWINTSVILNVEEKDVLGGFEVSKLADLHNVFS